MSTVDMMTVLELLAEAGAEIEVPIPGRMPAHVLCPFHAEDTASLAVWADHWHCFGCGKGGNGVDFIALVLGGSRGKAKAWLEGAAGEEIEWAELNTRREPEPVDLTEQFERESEWGDSRAAREYCERQWPHLTQINGTFQRLQEWGVRAGRNCLLIPHEDAEGVVRGVKVRSLTTGRKLAFPGSTYPQLYSVIGRLGAAQALLVEGESDTWTMTLQSPADIQVLGLPSGCNTWRRYLPELSTYEHAYVALDNDEPGEAAAQAIIEELNRSGESASRLKVVGHKDWTDLAVAEWKAS